MGYRDAESPESIPVFIDVAGWMNQHQLLAIDYLREENRILREHLGGRLWFSQTPITWPSPSPSGESAAFYPGPGRRDESRAQKA